MLTNPLNLPLNSLQRPDVWDDRGYLLGLDNSSKRTPGTRWLTINPHDLESNQWGRLDLLMGCRMSRC